ncbi:peptidase S14 [Mesorhizobium sp. M0955]|uniref:peptidase S14 n=1 Tax=Mesorhizobium sp. M0955 TaxID=2957033 RepID=UPI003339FCEF
MTTIAYKDGILAADSRAYSGDKMPMGFKTKIHRLKGGYLVGASSRDVGKTDAFIDWCRNHVNKGRHPGNQGNAVDIEVQAILVDPEGQVYYWYQLRCFSGPLKDEFFAIGSGDQFAYGAMKAGASAEEAVRIATECDPWSGGPIVTLKLEAPSPAPRKTRKKRK